MPLYRPSELQNFLASLGIRPRKGLSQNFLIDGNILKKISATAQLQTGDLVLEIGSGPGVLTEHLLGIGCRVIAIEKDTLFAEMLTRLQNEEKALEVIAADVLEVDFVSLLKKKTHSWAKSKSRR